MHLLYTISVHLVYLTLSILAVFSKKYKQFLESKSRLYIVKEKGLRQRILFHCASLGEYEMAKHFAQKLKNKQFDIVISFFSPSGFDGVPASNEVFDHKTYIPKDLAYKINDFLKMIDPDYVFIIKSEIWPNFLRCLKDKQIPFAFLGMDFTGNRSKYFSFPSSTLFRHLKEANHFFVQSDTTASVLRKQNIESSKISVCRNPRIESILNLTSKLEFKGMTKPLVVFGSVYSNDIPMIRELIQANPEFNYYVFPHHLDGNTQSIFKNKFTDFELFKSQFKNKNTLVLEIGILKQVYQHASYAYIGGGFQSGVHNTLEAILKACPTIIGPNNKAFAEVQELKNTAYLYIIEDKKDLNKTFQRMTIENRTFSEVESFLSSKPDCSNKIIDLVSQSI